MNNIKNIEIKNFKSIRHQTIDECRRINVFIGYPNVGKSNILEAIGLYSIAKSNNKISDFVRFEEIPTLFFNGDIETEFQVKINDHYIIHGFLSDGFLSIKKQYSNNENLLLAEDLNKQITSSGTDEIWSLQLNQNKSVNHFSIKEFLEISIGHFIGSVRKYSFKRYNIGREEYSHLSIPFGENLLAILSSHPKIRKDIVELFKPYDLLLNIDRTSNTLRVAKDLKDGTIFTIPFSMIAETLERLTFYKVAIMSNENSILLFEEPEAHMFPPYISKLTSDIINDENGNQFFLATHSPFVLNDLIANVEKDELSVYIVSYENETGETLIHRMDEEDVNEAYQFGYDFFMNINNFIPQKQHE